MTVYSHCVESFEGLLQRCRRGRGCSEWWKNTIFPEHPVHNLSLTEGRESQVRAVPPPCLNMSRQFLSQAGSIKCVVSAAKFSESETKKLYFSFWSRNRDSLPGKNVIVFSEKDICFGRKSTFTRKKNIRFGSHIFSPQKLSPALFSSVQVHKRLAYTGIVLNSITYIVFCFVIV